MPQPNVFISYNPGSEVEQTLAIRLHTIGAVSGFNMMLPDRAFGSAIISTETRNRMRLSDYFIVFSTGKLSRVVQEEISVAAEKDKDRSKILVIYDTGTGKNLTGLDNCTEVLIDTQKPADQIVAHIASELKAHQSKSSEGNGIMAALGSLLLIGVGLFALSELFEEKPARKKRTTGGRKPRRKTHA
jgi:hypothetical protein